MRQNQKGFTIIESLVAVAALGIFSVIFLYWVQLSADNMASLNQSDEVHSAYMKVRSALQDEDIYCTKIFGGRSLSTSIPEIRYYDAKTDTLSATPVLQKNGFLDPNRPTIKVKDIVIRPIGYLGSLYPTGGEPQTVVSNLEITFEKTKGTAEVVRRIPMNTTIQTGRILRCATSPAGKLVINNRLCEVKTDGYAYYRPDSIDPDTGSHCHDLPTVHWIQGLSPHTANCPAGMKVAIEEDHEVNPAHVVCRAVSTALVNVEPRTYQSGRTLDGQKTTYDRNFDFATGTCSFVYLAGFDTSTFKSYIKCVTQ